MSADLAYCCVARSVREPPVIYAMRLPLCVRSICTVTFGCVGTEYVDAAKQWLNDCLRAGHRTPITFTDEDEMGVEPA